MRKIIFSSGLKPVGSGLSFVCSLTKTEGNHCLGKENNLKICLEKRGWRKRESEKENMSYLMMDSGYILVYFLIVRIAQPFSSHRS